MINGQTLEQEVNEPKHYRSHESGIEAIEVTRWLQFDLGNCWKYCMRYRDKGTPKKDLKKALWYINDFHNYFIDYNNDSTFIHKVPEDVIEKMCKIIEAEPNKVIKQMLDMVLQIVTQNGILKPTDYEFAVHELEQFAETLEG